MNLSHSRILITGANRGLGLAFAQEALRLGARTVYAAARNPSAITLPGVRPVRLDVTRPQEAQAAAEACGDVDVVINNAGIAHFGGFLADDAVEEARAHFETNVLGPLQVTRAFAPVLARNGGGAIINVLSVVSWLPSSRLAAYAASKSAAWSLTNTLRAELARQGTHVMGLHIGFIDTDLAKDIDAPKVAPAAVARAAFEGLAQRKAEVLVDEASQQVKAGLSLAEAPYLRLDR